tara:strand:- start:319 stop:861 length:543 start_codon:yes stop_codon:yes gene_type:complete
MENTMIKNLEENTGKKFEEWLSIASKSGFEKHGELIKFLKTEYGLTHGYANLVAHKARQSDAESAEDADLIKDQYVGKETLKPLYDQLISEIQKFGKDVELAPKRAYVSLRRKKQFGLIQPSTKTRLDVGINLKGVEPKDKLEKAGSWNTMVSHRVKLSADDKIDSDLISWLKAAYEGAS